MATSIVRRIEHTYHETKWSVPEVLSSKCLSVKESSSFLCECFTRFFGKSSGLKSSHDIWFVELVKLMWFKVHEKFGRKLHSAIFAPPKTQKN